MRILASAHHLSAFQDAVAPSTSAAPASIGARPPSEFILSSPAIIRREPAAAEGEASIEPAGGGDQHGKEEP